MQPPDTSTTKSNPISTKKPRRSAQDQLAAIEARAEKLMQKKAALKKRIAAQDRKARNRVAARHRKARNRYLILTGVAIDTAAQKNEMIKKDTSVVDMISWCQNTYITNAKDRAFLQLPEQPPGS